MPLFANLFHAQIDALQEEGKVNRDLQIKLQSRIFDIANTLKDFEGSVIALRREGVVEQKRKDEAEFTRWVNANPDRQKKYGDVLPALQKAYEELAKTQPRDTLIAQIAGLDDTFDLAGLVAAVAADKEQPLPQRNARLALVAMQVRAAVPGVVAERRPGFERRVLAFLLREAAELPAGQKIEPIEKRFGSLTGDARVRAEEEFARSVAESKNFSSAQPMNALFDM